MTVTGLVKAEALLLALAVLLAVAGVVGYKQLQASVLTIAVAPRDGTEPELIGAYADALAAQHEDVQLKLQLFDDVRESAKALEEGRADLAVVRPDVELPGNGLTIAILRDQAMLIVSPASAGIRDFATLSGKRLGIVAHALADRGLLETLLGYNGLALEPADRSGPVGPNHVRLIPVDEAELALAFRTRHIDAVMSIIAPSAPRALRLVDDVAGVSADHKVNFVKVEDDDAIIERFPVLQAVTVPSGLFGGHPQIPDDDIKTVGTSYRLMARASLNRTVVADLTQHLFELRTAVARKTEAAYYVQAPAYETTAAATSARLPIHPGAIDYFEREQRTFIDRYGDAIYLLAFVGGGLGSALAWVRQRLARLRRERIDEITDRLIQIVGEVRGAAMAKGLDDYRHEVEDLVAEVLRNALEREPSSRALTVVAMAIDAARDAVSPEAPARLRSADRMRLFQLPRRE